MIGMLLMLASAEGVYDTTYGRMRLTQEGDRVAGTYSYGDGSTIEGELDGTTFRFRYAEPTAQGEGEFEFDEEFESFAGRWRAEGAEEWSEWEGTRVHIEEGVQWLVILEAPWEESLAEPEYSFGEMLRTYFARYPDVRVRHRRVQDVADFERAAGEIGQLLEPTVVLVASHGSTSGLSMADGDVGADAIRGLLEGAPQVYALHFSSCEIMGGEIPRQVLDGLPSGRRVAISGYAVVVDWSGSALVEYLYLDLILGRGLTPAEAAEEVQADLRFAGDEEGSELGAAHFRFIER